MKNSKIFLLFVFFHICCFGVRGNELDEDLSEDPISLVNREGEPSAFVQGVNVLTGDFVDHQVDFTHVGTAPLPLSRTSVSSNRHRGSLYHSGDFDFFCRLKMHPNSPKYTYREGISQLTLRFDDHFLMKVCKKTLRKGVTNTGRGRQSAQTNIKNLQCMSKGFFERQLIDGSKNIKEFTLANTDLVLKKEKKPSGIERAFIYHPLKYPGTPLKSVLTKNALGNTLNGFTFDYQPEEEFKKNLTLDVTTWDQRTIRYLFQKIDHKYFIKEVQRPQFPWLTYQRDQHGKIIARSLPEERFLQVRYYGVGKNPHHGETLELRKGDPRMGRVHFLLAPLGEDQTPIPAYSFKYDFHLDGKGKLKSGVTSVLDAYSNLSQYSYNGDFRLTEIEKFNQQQLHSRERLFWGANDTPDSTNLLVRTAESPTEGMVFATTYQYDAQGNVMMRNLLGNLSGQNSISPVINADGSASINGCEAYVKQFFYSQDGLNLLLHETDGRQSISYTYQPASSLLTAKFLACEGNIYQRTFYFYDSNGSLVEEILDDGTTSDIASNVGVSERYITTYSPRTGYPVGLPQVIEESCQDLTTNAYHLIHKKINTYDVWGRLIAQEHYGSDNQYAYTLYWEYDHHGNLLKETDALGRTIIRHYDENDNLIFEQGPRTDCCKTFSYDRMNRLVCEEEFHSDAHLITTHRYNHLGHRIGTQDPYGNETHFECDPFGRVVKITRPELINSDHTPYRPVTHQEYDLLGNVTKVTDPAGNVTQTSYNIRGQACRIEYPNGAIEENSYHHDGRLKKSIAKNGAVTHYLHDFANRPIRQETYYGEELLKVTSFKYSTFHLVAEADPSNTITYYSYYPNGKLKSKVVGDHCTSYTYDALGRVQDIKEQDGPNPEDCILTRKTYNLLDWVLSEEVEDGQGHLQRKTQYAYDMAGNCTHVIRTMDGKTSTTITDYNSYNLPVKEIDPEGNVTLTTYRYDYQNSQGKTVPYKEITDPQGNVTIIIHDTHGHLAEMTRKNSLGVIVQKQRFFYDLQGNHDTLIETVFSSQAIREMTTKWRYDSLNNLIACVEAAGTPEQKTTLHRYHPSGQKESTTKPDGMVIRYSHNALDQLTSLRSADDAIHYNYRYDCNGNPIEVLDITHNTSTRKTYDIYNNVLKETLANGLSLSYTYDQLNRLKTVTLPDNTSIGYIYQGLNLQEVTRGNYSHQYLSYDLAGNVLSSQLMGKAGLLSATYDTLNRLTSLKSPLWQKEQITYDSLGNLLTLTTTSKNKTTSCSYTYDDLNQLTLEKGPSPHEYGYDSLYNRLSKDGKPYFTNALNHLLDDSLTSYAYDLNGNRIQAGKTTYIYDPLNRLISVTNDTLQVHYTYDELDRRLSKRIWDGTQWHETRYLYLGQQEIGAYQQEQCRELRILGRGQLAQTLAIELNNKLYAPLHDQNGNIAALIDAESGKLQETYSYTAFGELLFTPTKNHWLVAGKRYDPETGFIYFGKRYYDPLTGHWLTPDPLGFADGWNLYAYLRNNPFRYYDPDGQCVVLVVPLVALALGAGTVVIETVTTSAITQAIIVAALGVIVSQTNTWHDERYCSEIIEEKAKEKKKQYDGRLPSDPDALLNDSKWEETTHSKAKEKGHRTFENKETGEKIRYDERKSEQSGHRGESHWHRYNPNSTSRHDEYLDANDNPVPRNSPESHLYPHK